MIKSNKLREVEALSRTIKLASEHWDWLQSILDTQRAVERKLFVDAFIHGYKHGQKDKE